MELYPSIDLREGKVVRLMRGDYDAQMTYSDDPLAVAREFDAAGARWIHVVDLDAARVGGATNLRIIEAICANVEALVQTGGGVRGVEDASSRFAAGVARVVVGSAAVEQPELVEQLTTMHPGQVAIGLDARGRDVAIHGWEQSTGADLVTLAKQFDRPGVAAIIVTEIGRDGTLSGPDLDTLDAVHEAVALPMIASGGVGTIGDLEALAERKFAGAIVGRAIYEGRFTLAEGIAACSPSA